MTTKTLKKALTKGIKTIGELGRASKKYSDTVIEYRYGRWMEVEK